MSDSSVMLNLNKCVSINDEEAAMVMELMIMVSYIINIDDDDNDMNNADDHNDCYDCMFVDNKNEIMMLVENSDHVNVTNTLTADNYGQLNLH